MSEAPRTRQLREHLAGYSYQAAYLLAEQARELEAKDLDPSPGAEGNDLQRLRSFAIGAVLSAAAAIEAKANDLYISCRDRDTKDPQGSDPRLIRMVEETWNEVERLPALRKLQIFISFANRPALDEGGLVFQSASDLIALRNRLTHYKAEWQSDSSEDEKLGKRLRGKFVLNRHARPEEPFMPHKCLGAGVAKWAVETLDALELELSERLPWTRGYTLRRVRTLPPA